jgi:hypothetical protein
LKFHDFFTHALNIFLHSLDYGSFQIVLHTSVVLPSLFVVDILPLPSVTVPSQFLSRLHQIHSANPRHLSLKENTCCVASGKLNYTNSSCTHNIYAASSIAGSFYCIVDSQTCWLNFIC